AIGGSWQWGWGHQDDVRSVRTIHRALDRGINWIDTAPVYGLGHAEEILGQALAEAQQQPYVFTKCGLVWDERRRVRHLLEPDSITREIEASLRRLGVEAIDLYQIHWPDPDAAIEAAVETLARLQSQGKLRHIGVSNFSTDQLERVRPLAEIVSLQPPYSLIQREAEEAILPYCLSHGLGAINYSPLASGLLSGAMTRERLRELPDDDWRKRNKRFKEPQLTRHLKLAKRLTKMGAHRGRTTAEMAIAWALQHPAITGTIVGLRAPEQVDGVIGAVDIELRAEETQRLGNG
ncbi:MAG: aldo/keto reductase, partial [Acidobacteriota bacterium]